MRIVKTIKNLILSWLGYFAVILATFIGRKVFVDMLGSMYLGVQALFTNILSCLNLADLGLSVAITYSLYKPLAENDTEKISAILSLFHKVYLIVGVTVGVIGLGLTPFLHFFINEMPKGLAYSKIQVYFVLFVLNNSLNYFMYYKAVLINADQKKYIVELNYSINMIAMTVIQILILICFKSFLLYLIIQLIFTGVRNMSISLIANRQYPYLKDKTSYSLSKQDKKELTMGVAGMMFQKLGTVVVNSTDNIIISKFISIIIVGIYSNYYSIISAINMVLNQVFKSALASVGNFNVTAKKEELADVFDKSLFVNFWIHGFCSIALTCLLNPFIHIWLGKDYLLEMKVVIILGFNFYLNGMRQTSLMFNDALGLYWKNRYKPIFEALVNLAMSLILVRFWGIQGVFLGTTCSIIFVCMWAEPYIIFKYVLKRNLAVYFRKYLVYFATSILIGFITYLLCNSIYMDGFLAFICKCSVCVVLPNILFLLIFRKTSEFKYFYNFLTTLKK